MKIRIGTRGSKLALTQTELVIAALKAAFPEIETEIRTIQTLGDRKQGVKNAAHDKKDWIIDLENGLLAHEIDIAVHSGKDVPLNTEPGTVVVPVLTRADPRDCFIGKINPATGEPFTLATVPHGATIGTASVRRAAMLRRARPDIVVVEHRGNVPTRLRKLEESTELSGIILAEAGISRLGLSEVVREQLSTDLLLPSINQGIITTQYRSGDSRMKGVVASLIDPRTAAAFSAERQCAIELNGDCNSAIGNYAVVDDSTVWMRGVVLSPDGARALVAERRGEISKAAELGTLVGAELMERGAGELLRGTLHASC